MKKELSTLANDVPGLADAYRYVQRRARRFNLLGSLKHMWVYMHHMTDRPRRPLPLAYVPPIQLPTPGEIPFSWLPPHQLDLVLRELILHGDLHNPGTRNLQQWDHIARLANAVKMHAELAAEARGEEGLYETLHLIGHQQLPWQQLSLKRDMTRMAILLRSPAVRPLVEGAFGMTVEQYFTVAFWTLALAHERPCWRRTHDYGLNGISNVAVEAFNDRISDSILAQRASQKAFQEHTPNWEYSWNPLQFKPLIAVQLDDGIHYYCPAPSHLHRRLFAGAFYDLVSVKGFPEAFGNAFGDLVGLVLQRGCPALQARKPKPYRGPSGSKHEGTDWIGSDGTATVFVECKAKRLTRDAQVLRDPAELDKDIRELAKAVYQNYRNIQEAMDGCTDWSPDGLPIYNIVATLEDWILFSPMTQQRLAAYVLEWLREKGLDPTIVERIPYSICCVYELEELVFAWCDRSVQGVMAARHGGEHDRWMIGPYLRANFENVRQRAHELLTTESEMMFAEIEGIVKAGST